jgi:hypothetical protein
MSDFHFSCIGTKENYGLKARFNAKIINRKTGSQQGILAKYAGIHSSALAEAAAEFVHNKLGDHSFVLVSGDLASHGFQCDLKLAYEYVSSNPSSAGMYMTANTFPTLNTQKRPIIVMPGNHDRFKDIIGSPRSSQFERIFSPILKKPPSAVQNFVIKGSGIEISLICADFTLEKKNNAAAPGILPHAGQGYAYAHIIQELKSQTLQIQKLHPSRFIIWVSHFPPMPSHIIKDPKLELIKYDELILAADSCNISYILSGHVHRPEHHYFKAGSSKDGITVNNRIDVIAVGTACVEASLDGNHINSVSIKKSAGKYSLQADVYEFKKKRNQFILSSSVP